MSEESKKKLRRAMEEASFLPAGSSRRSEIAAEISREGEWAEVEWHELLAENERLRLDLGRVTAPAGLEESLLQLPEKLSYGRFSLNRLVCKSFGLQLQIMNQSFFSQKAHVY